MDFMQCGLVHAKQPDFCDLPYNFGLHGFNRFNFIFFGVQSMVATPLLMSPIF